MTQEGRDRAAASRDTGPAAPSWTRLLVAYLHAGLWVGLLGGALIGGALGTALARAGTISLVLATGSDRIIAFAFLVASTALLCAGAVGVAALAGASAARLSPAVRRRLRPWRYALIALATGTVAVATFLWVALHLGHGLRSGLAVLALAGFALLPPSLLVSLGAGRAASPAAAQRRVPVLGAAALAALLALAGATVAWTLPRLQDAETGAGHAISGSSVSPRPAPRPSSASLGQDEDGDHGLGGAGGGLMP